MPHGFDEYASKYEKYLCYGAKIDVRAVNASTTAYEIGIGVLPDDSSFANFGAFIQDPGTSKLRLIGSINGGRNVVRLRRFQKTRHVFGVSKAQFEGDTNYNSDVTTIPGHEAYFIIAGRPMDGASSVTIYLRVEIIYYVKFWLRKEQAQE